MRQVISEYGKIFYRKTQDCAWQQMNVDDIKGSKVFRT